MTVTGPSSVCTTRWGTDVAAERAATGVTHEPGASLQNAHVHRSTPRPAAAPAPGSRCAPRRSAPRPCASRRRPRGCVPGAASHRLAATAVPNSTLAAGSEPATVRRIPGAHAVRPRRPQRRYHPLLHQPRIHLHAQGAIEPALEAAQLLGIPRAFLAGGQMLAQPCIVIRRFGQHCSSDVCAIHHSSGSRVVSSPHMTRSCLRARNRRVSTAAFDRSKLRGNLGRRIAHQDLHHQRFAVLAGELEYRSPKLRELLVIRRSEHRLLLGDEFLDVHGDEPLAFETARIFPADDGQEPGFGGRPRPAGSPGPSTPGSWSPAPHPRPRPGRGPAKTQNGAGPGAGIGTAPESARAVDFRRPDPSCMNQHPT